MNGANCQFDPETHTYTQDFVDYPSATEILREVGIGDDFSGIPRATLEYARERGSYVDSCLRLYDAGELDETRINPEAVGYLNAYKKFGSETGFKVYAWGQPTVAEINGMKFGMTEDITGWWRDEPWLIDVKCTAEMPESVVIQTAAYVLGKGDCVVSDQGIESYDFVKGYTTNDLADPSKLRVVPWRRGALQLFPDATYRFDAHATKELASGKRVLDPVADHQDKLEFKSALFLVTRRSNRRKR